MYCSRGTTLFVFLSSRSPLQYRSVSEKDHSFRVPVLHGNSPSLLLAFACWTWKTFFRGPLAMRFRDGSSFRSCTSYRIAAGSQSRTLSVSAGQTYTVVDVNNSTRFAKCQLDKNSQGRGKRGPYPTTQSSQGLPLPWLLVSTARFGGAPWRLCGPWACFNGWN